MESSFKSKTTIMASQQQFSQQQSQQSQQPELSQQQQQQQQQSGKKRIFVTGASGQTGIHVLKHLSNSSDKFEVCAGVYAERQEEAQKCVQECCSGAKVCPIDADDVDSLTEAFRGVDDLFIVPTATDYKVSHARNYIRAAKQANVKFVLLLSMTGAEDRNYLFADQFSDIEETLKRSGIENYCVLRSNFYMQNLLLYKDQLKAGALPLPIQMGSFNPIDVDDIGKAAQCILANCSAHRGKWYNLTGPKCLNGQEMAEIFSKVLGNSVKWQDIPRAEARSILRKMNVPQSEAQGLLEFYELVQKNQLKDQEKNDFKTITGTDPTPLDTFLSRHKQEITTA
jgi:NAD(P)H dehydrogenase (quinone)